MKIILPIIVALLAAALPLRAEIIQTAYLQTETMDLTAVGTIDWCVYRVDDTNKPTFPAADWKKSGVGITREIRARGIIKKNEVTKFTGVGWGWTDGTRRGSHSRRQGDDVYARLGLRWNGIASHGVPGPSGCFRQAGVIGRCQALCGLFSRAGGGPDWRAQGAQVAAYRRCWRQRRAAR